MKLIKSVVSDKNSWFMSFLVDRCSLSARFFQFVAIPISFLGKCLLAEAASVGSVTTVDAGMVPGTAHLRKCSVTL